MPPIFAFCGATCQPPDPTDPCFSPPNLDYIITEDWDKWGHRAEVLTRDLLTEWGLATKGSLQFGEKQIFVYIPPCGAMVDLAMCFSVRCAFINKKVFAEEVQNERSYPRLPCKIRIDDRLSHESCAMNNTLSRMRGLRDYLKECASNSRDIIGRGFLRDENMHSGPWAASNFDIPYLDRRCYELGKSDAAATASILTLDDVAKDTPNKAWATGNLVLSDQKALERFISANVTDGSGETLHVSPSIMFKLDLKGDGMDLGASFFGEYAIAPLVKRQEAAAAASAASTVKPEDDDKINWQDLGAKGNKTKLAKLAFKHAKKFLK